MSKSSKGPVGAFRTIRWMQRAEIRANPTALYVFGDNLLRVGLGGQARECRGEPNAVGIPTKKAPTMEAHAFLSDADLWRVGPIVDLAFERLREHLTSGGDVYWPEAGIGTERARLQTCAPAIAKYIEDKRAELAAKFEPEKGAPEKEKPATPHSSDIAGWFL